VTKVALAAHITCSSELSPLLSAIAAVLYRTVRKSAEAPDESRTRRERTWWDDAVRLAVVRAPAHRGVDVVYWACSPALLSMVATCLQWMILDSYARGLSGWRVPSWSPPRF